MTGKTAYWRVPLDVLASALMLPDGVEIHATRESPDQTCDLLLAGHGLPDDCQTDGDPVEVRGEYVDQDGAVRLFFEKR